MDGVHDMGGMHGFGKVEIEENEPAFREPWEGRVVGIARLTPVRMPGGRYRIESLDPAFYLASSYYEKWLHAGIHGFVQHGIITEAELEAKIAEYRDNGDAPMPPSDPERYEAAQEAIRMPRPKKGAEPPPPPEPRFEVGDRVHAKNVHPDGHTRLPRYLRGKVGEVIRHYRPQGFQDDLPLSDHEGPQPMYAVRFEGREVWGESAEPDSSVCLDMWEAYLEPVE